MATEVNLMNTLVSGTSDRKLAHTDNIYDKVQKMMQELINQRLAKFFVLSTDGEVWEGGLNGKALAEESVGINKLSPEAQALLNKSTELATAISQLNLAAWGIQSSLSNLTDRVAELERVQDSTILPCEEDGFFLVDENKYIGACVTPLYSLGWDGPNAGAVPTYSTNYGGNYIVIKGANFNEEGNERNLGQLGQGSAFNYLTLRVLSNSNNIVRVQATPSGSYSGGYNWYLRNNTEYFSLKSGQGTDTAEFAVGPGASNFNITIYCRATANGVEGETTVNVSYTQPGVAVGQVSVQLYQAYGHTTTSSSDPIEAPSFKAKVTYIPSDATISGYNWAVVNDSGEAVTIASEAERHSQVCTFNIDSSTSTVVGVTVSCSVTDTLGNVVYSAPMRVYVKYAAIPVIQTGLRGIQATTAATMPTKEQDVEVDGLYESNEGQSTSVRKAPASADEYTLEVESGHAVIKDNSTIVLTDDAVLGEEIVVRATAENPNYDSSDEDSEEQFISRAKTQCAYKQSLKSITINVLNQTYDGNILFLGVVSNPDYEEYRSVTWSVAGSRLAMMYVRIDSETGRLELLSGLTEYVDIIVNARSTVDPNISAEPLYLRVKYDNTQRPIRIIRPLAAVGDQYVDFSAVGHTGNCRDDYSDISDTRLKWEVLEVVSAQQASEAVVYWNQHNYSSLSPKVPKAQTLPALPVNGTSNGTLVATEANEDLADFTNTTANTTFYAKDDVVAYVGAQEIDESAPQIVPVIFTPTVVLPESSETIPSRGPLRSRSVYSAPTFGDGTEGKPKNRLFLANTSDGLQQGVCVRCTLLEEDGVTEVKHVDYYYEFTYREAGRLPVTAIGFRQIVTDGRVTVLPNGNLSINVPYYESWAELKRLVVPLVNGEYVEGEPCLFDPDRLHFSSNNGHCESDVWHVASYAGKVLPYKSGSEQITVSYALLGEMPYYTKNHDRSDYDSMQGDPPLHYYYCARNRINKTADVTITKEIKTYSTNAIKIRCNDTYEVTVVGQNYYVENPDSHQMELNNVWSPLSGAGLSITDMEGNPVLDQNGNVMQGAFRVVDTNEVQCSKYFSIGINGSPMNIGNTGTSNGDNSGTPVGKPVKVEATLGNMKAIANFTVKMIMQN